MTALNLLPKEYLAATDATAVTIIIGILQPDISRDDGIELISQLAFAESSLRLFLLLFLLCLIPWSSLDGSSP